MTDPAADGRSRARVTTDRKIDEAVMRIVADEGPAAVTIARVSEVSGVARTTLYRRYASSSEILSDAVGRIAPMPPIDVTSDREGFRRIVGQFERVFSTEGLASLTGHVLVANEGFQHQWRTQFIGIRLGSLHSFLERGVQAGVLRPDLDTDLVVELIVGSAIAEAALRGRLLGGWADRVVETLWPALSAQHPERGARPLDA
ncbi:MAG: TetR/AcrR family transcriptional regulator C-terminal ligand-binding domain-containing protein [Propionibacteriaceae bacterium]|nr:TetR/AcrR family transcriptional regulator C-terminal ligand-binding domain-containing protein [Propionibacteriaceae bacterium]